MEDDDEEVGEEPEAEGRGVHVVDGFAKNISKLGHSAGLVESETACERRKVTFPVAVEKESFFFFGFL